MTLILWDLLSDTTQQIKGIMELPRHPSAYINKGNFHSETFSDGKYSNNELKNKRSHIFVVLRSHCNNINTQNAFR